jgi:ketosteroid isomerase-like protein
MPERPDVAGWLADWVACIRDRDVDRGRRLFAADCISFGTRGEVLRGLDELAEQQWAPVWAATRDFAFMPDDTADFGRSDESVDDDILVVCRRWTSTGIRPDGSGYPREGRATIVLCRAPDAPHGLRAVHTHLSLRPDT